MKKSMLAVLLAVLFVSSGAYAITITVGSAGDHATLNAAFLAASTGDVVSIIETATYDIGTASIDIVTDALTLEAAVGISPVIINTDGNPCAIFDVLAADTFSVGDNAKGTITFVGDANPGFALNPAVNNNSANVDGSIINVENCTIQSTGYFGALANGADDAVINADNCLILNCLCPLDTWWDGAGSQYNITNTTFSGCGGGYTNAYHRNTAGGDVVISLTQCLLANAATAYADFNVSAGNTLNISECDFDGSGSASQAVRLTGGTVNIDNSTFRLYQATAMGTVLRLDEWLDPEARYLNVDNSDIYFEATVTDPINAIHVSGDEAHYAEVTDTIISGTGRALHAAWYFGPLNYTNCCIYNMTIDVDWTEVGSDNITTDPEYVGETGSNFSFVTGNADCVSQGIGSQNVVGVSGWELM